MAGRIMFIQGAWVTPLCWEDRVRFFTAKGAEYASAWIGEHAAETGGRA